MKEHIAFDSHKHYPLVAREEVTTGRCRQVRVEHARGAIAGYLAAHPLAPGTAVAVAAMGRWYWLIDEIEQAQGCRGWCIPAKPS